MAIEDLITGAESGGNPNARNPRSSAVGLGQFIESTWLNTLAKYRPDLVQGRSRDQILALRKDPQLSTDMTRAYARENSAALSNAGLPVTPGTTYLAHFAGPQGAINVLKADPSAPASSVLGSAAVAANPFLRNMSIGQLRNWASSKVGGGVGSLPAEAGASGGRVTEGGSNYASAPPVQAAGSTAPSYSPPPQQQQPSPTDIASAIGTNQPEFFTPPPLPQQQLQPLQPMQLPPTQLPAGLLRARMMALRGSLNQDQG